MRVPKNRNLDWEGIKREYLKGARTNDSIANEYGLSEGAIRKKAKLLGWIKENAEAKRPVKLQKDAYDTSGFIYVVYVDSGIEKLYKIGMAENFNRRFTEHQCSSPFDVMVAICYFTSNMRNEEHYLHERYLEKNVRGEWFRLDFDDLKEIATRSLLDG